MQGHLLPGLSQSKDANPSSTNACQHLQALRLENLQLKAMLKAEVEARQLVEQQNAALAQLIRCGCKQCQSFANECNVDPLQMSAMFDKQPTEWEARCYLHIIASWQLQNSC